MYPARHTRQLSRLCPWPSSRGPAPVTESLWHTSKIKLCDKVLERVNTSSSDRVLRVGVLGGSVTTGGGCGKTSWVALFKVMLQEVLSCQGVRADVEIVNRARGASGSLRGFLCYDALFGDWVPDVLLLEYAINDRTGETLELLLRSLPLQVAPVMISVYSLRGGFGNAQFDQDALARYYDVPLVSIRDALRPGFVLDSDAEERWFSEDRHHPSCDGHFQIAQLITNFFARVLLKAEHHSAMSMTPGYSSAIMSQAPLKRLVRQYPPYYYTPGLRPTCRIAEISKDWYELRRDGNSNWTELEGGKPGISCKSQSDGAAFLHMQCVPRAVQASCTLLISYTASWQPMGTIALSLPGSPSPTLISAFIPSWREQNIQYTVVQWFKATADLPAGTHAIEVRCTGTSKADETIPSAYDRREFWLHGFVVIKLTLKLLFSRTQYVPASPPPAPSPACEVMCVGARM